MAGAGEQFLAGAGFALDQQGRIQGRHAPRLAHHGGHHPRALEDAVEATQLVFAHVVDAFADAVGTVQGKHGTGQGFAFVVLGLQRRDIGEEGVALDLDAQAIDPRLVGAHQLRQVEVFHIARQRNARHLVHPHPEQLRGGTVGGDYGTAHVDGQHRKVQRAQQGVQLQVAALAGHQADALDAEYAGDGFELGPQGLQLQVDQVRAEQVDGVALVAADFAAIDVDAVVDEQVEDVAEDSHAVLAMDFDTHQAPLGRAFPWVVDEKIRSRPHFSVKNM
ncbi:hypothetical protein D3C85_1014120 [compost metagenome]